MTVQHAPLPISSATLITTVPRISPPPPYQVAAQMCAFAGHTCGNVRTTKRNGSLARLCETHRAQATNAQRRKQQRDRLLRYLVTALQDDDPILPGMPEHDARSRQRPRLVLLGNQQTLILGVVLSDRAASAAADLAGRRS